MRNRTRKQVTDRLADLALGTGYMDEGQPLEGFQRQTAPLQVLNGIRLGIHAGIVHRIPYGSIVRLQEVQLLDGLLKMAKKYAVLMYYIKMVRQTFTFLLCRAKISKDRTFYTKDETFVIAIPTYIPNFISIGQ